MGMDVWGLKPSSPAGRYFRANIWSWRPIHELNAKLCGDLLDEETLQKMTFNDGAGPTDPDVCKKMAERFEQWLEHHTEGHQLDLGLRVTSEGRFVPPNEVATLPAEEVQELRSPYAVEDEHLKEWVAFLRDCGGFEVW